MKFTLETEPFTRLLGMLAQARPDRRRKFAPVRLDASRGRLRAQLEQLAAEIEAVVWQDGCCVTGFGKLLATLQAESCTPSLEIEAEDGHLRVGDSFLTCIDECTPASTAASSRIFFASDLGVVPSGVPEVSLAN
jgi:hypothetical protein